MNFEQREPSKLEVIHPGMKKPWGYQLQPNEELHVVRSLDRNVVIHQVFYLPRRKVLITLHNRSKKTRMVCDCIVVEVLVKEEKGKTG